MLASMTGYALSLEIIKSSNAGVPSHRMPSGLYVSVSTAYGQSNTASRIVMADYSVQWNESLTIQGRPLMFPQWLMSIFPSTSKTVCVEIRASFETEMLGRGEVMGRVETTFQELLLHDKEFEILFPDAKASCPSLLLRARRANARQSADRASAPRNSEIGLLTDKAHEIYGLYRKNHHPNDLDKTIKSFKAVLDLCPVEHPHRAAALSNLAHVIIYGFTKGVQTDINHAISLLSSALTLRPGGHPDHLLSIFNLCKAHRQRYSCLRDRSDLHEAVKLYIRLLPNCLEGSYLQLCVIEECNALPGDPSDESISLRRMVLHLCPEGHKHHARSLNRLAGDLYTRFKQSHNTDDINEAVHLSREALAMCDGGSERSFYLSVLSYTLKLRFHHLRNTADINECISLNREALSLRPPGHPARHRSLNNLAKALKARHHQYGNTADLEEAKDLDQVSHDLSPGKPLGYDSEEQFDLGDTQLSRTLGPEDEQQRQPPVEALLSDHHKTGNVVIFGESGSGKSSVVNAITQSQRAKTSSSAAGCTFRYEKHEVDLPGKRFILFDTVGLDEGTAGTVPAAEAEENLKSLLRELMSPGSDGIGLLVYCVRSVRVSRALLRNYNLFYSAICRKKVPIVVIVTGLENHEPTMDSWWDTNGKEFKRCGMHFEDHACVTTLPNHSGIPDVFSQRITESRQLLRRLILDNCSEWTADESWFKLSFADVRNMISGRRNTGRSSPQTLIICDPSQKEVEIAHGIHGAVETCFVRINGVKYQVHIVTEPKSSIPTSSIEADLLIYYAHADEQDSTPRRFSTFCEAYRGNMIPVVVVVKGLDNSKAAQEWVGRHLVQNGAGRLFATYVPMEDLRDRIAEQELEDLIQHSCLIRSEERGEGVQKGIVSALSRWV